MAQVGSKMAQVGSKVGPEMRKVAKVKLSKNHLFLQCFGPPGRLKMTPRGPQMAHLDPRGLRPKMTSREAPVTSQRGQESSKSVFGPS